MRIKDVHIQSFKRFNDFTIKDIPETARLVVLAGPNGTGKSSVFDAFRIWCGMHGLGISGDKEYAHKKGLPDVSWEQYVKVTLDRPVPADPQAIKMFYFRTAYRNEPDFTVATLQKMGPISSLVNRFIDNDATVLQNYQRLVSASVEGLYSGTHDAKSVKDLREIHIGEVRNSMARVFGDLLLSSVGDPLKDGTFFFDKGASKNFHYKNLSGGEKAAFDLLLDIILKRATYDDSIYCIDEPEMHMHSRLQSLLLAELLTVIPANCQLWIASHSIGMMRKAKDLHAQDPGSTVFLDFQEIDFDKTVTLAPVKVNRGFWLRTLNVALDDLADLVAPARVVLCEGRPVGKGDPAKAELDASCYRAIFAAEFADTDFVSVGNATDVSSDRLEVGKTIQTIVSGTAVVRLVDQDDRSSQEIADLQKEGIRVLSRRHLEAYLMDDEILRKLCEGAGQPTKVPDVLAAKTKAIAQSVASGNPADDVKSAGGPIYVAVKNILKLTQCGNTTHAFPRDTLAPLVTPATAVYKQLKADIFT